MTLMYSRHVCAVCPGHVLGTSSTSLLCVSTKLLFNFPCQSYPRNGKYMSSKWGHWLTQESFTSHLPTHLSMEFSGKWISNVLDGEVNIEILSAISNHGIFGSMDSLSNSDMISQWYFLPCPGKHLCSWAIPGIQKKCEHQTNLPSDTSHSRWKIDR